jgi:hypothetical protein
MVWDGSKILLFGGNSTSGFLNDTWTFLHGSWTRVPSLVSPPARAEASMAYDAAAQSTILYGGEAYRTLVSAATETYVGADYNDTWSFSAGQWTQLHPSNSPGARDSAMMAYDPATQEVVLFGGFNWTIYSTADTWAFANGTWNQVPGGAGPSSRNSGALAYDANLGGLVLFGGHDGWLFLSDTWLWANSTWTDLGGSAAGPAPRWGASEAPDAAGCLLLFGGSVAQSGNAANGSYFNDTSCVIG